MLLTLAADARLCSPDYTNDHIWELNLRGGNPPALAVETTYGLRARSMRLFPRFLHQSQDILSPQLFFQPPLLNVFYPNYLSFCFSPFEGLEIRADYWVPQSQAITGRLVFRSQSTEDLDFGFEWVALLDPMPNGESMRCESQGMIHILQGKTSNLAPVCVLTGGPEPGGGPYPALYRHCHLSPAQSWECHWALAAQSSPEQSLALARQITARNWEAETARIEVENDRQAIHISTGNPDWDACFAFAQKTAYSLFLQRESSLPFPSFVRTRQPDQGYASRENGSDSPYSWSGQTALDAYYLSSILLPGGVELIKGVVDNFLNVQTEQGNIDWKPGLGGQRSHQLAQPLLAVLASNVFEYTRDKTWLLSIYPRLIAFLRVWFSPQHDRDGDGYPEWENPIQTGLEDSPLYDYWEKDSDAVSISSLEAPSLAAFLYRECAALLEIAALTDQNQDLDWLHSRMNQLEDQLLASWSGREKIFRYRDYASHSTNKGILLRTVKGQPEISFRRTFKSPQRLNFVFEFQNETTRPITIQIRGTNGTGPLHERIAANQFIWGGGIARCTSDHLYTGLENIEVTGFYAHDVCNISTADYSKEDISLLLPLWAGAIERGRAKMLVEKRLLPHFLKKYGIPISPQGKEVSRNTEKVTLIWNNLIGEGLLNYGYRKEAARLVTSLMKGVVDSMKNHHAFHQYYNAYHINPSGERNHLEGLAPVGLFLKTLGLKKLNREEILLEGSNPYPWPVTVAYQGLKITFNKKENLIRFASGQTAVVRGSGPHRISLV